MNIYRLKIWPEYFDPILSGVKRFEVLRGDFFEVGHILDLQEYCPERLRYTQRSCLVRITYIYPSPSRVHEAPVTFPPGVVVLAFDVIHFVLDGKVLLP